MIDRDDSRVGGATPPDPYSPASRHRHRLRRVRVLSHWNGVPYEIERILCSRCAETLAQRTLRRVSA